MGEEIYYILGGLRQVKFFPEVFLKSGRTSFSYLVKEICCAMPLLLFIFGVKEIFLADRTRFGFVHDRVVKFPGRCK